MVESGLIKPAISIFLWINIVYCNCYEEFDIEGSYIESNLAKCRLEEGESIFHCTRSSLLKTYTNISDESNTNLYKLNYYGWLLSMPVLSPNTVIYNDVPQEVDQSDLYVHNYLKEPKFTPLYYKLRYNEYYDHLREHITAHLRKEAPKSRVAQIKDQANEILGLPKIVIEAKSSHTTSFDENFLMELYGDEADPENEYSRSLLLFLDYYIFRPVKRRSYLLKFLNTYKIGYRLRFYMYCKGFSNLFKRYRHFFNNKEAIVKLMSLSKYFNIVRSKVEPFIPMPVDDDYDGKREIQIPLSVITTNKQFCRVVQDILAHCHENVDLVLDSLGNYMESLYKVEDPRTIPTLDSFYVLEVLPKSTGFSLYNLFPQGERKQILDYKDSILVESHVSKLDSSYFLFQIVNKFVITLPLIIIFSVMLFKYIFKYVK
ncbi:hypothetical protein MACK_001566 [Theileria orientalis]|uniref:Uncharacterized protein n=1 Tax=Theileria orientalis TaxID=68886 RepID=A0A976MCP4_THEOR|nr:hypothetical protein MACK_001566 [Theileria orientalis]